MSGSFNQVFGGNSIYPSDPTYLELSLTEDVTLQWPIEQQIGGDLIVADIMDINSSTPGLSITLSNAQTVSTGYTALFNNVGSQTVTIKDADGGTIVSLVSGTVWEIYLTDNSTEAGTWRVFQFGASVSVAVAAALAGAGLKAIATTLNEKMAISSKAGDYVILDSDRANVINWTAGAGTFTLPDPGTVGNDWFVTIRNSGSGDLVVTPGAGQIDGDTSKTYSAGSSSFVTTDGSNYYTIGFGSGGSSSIGFDHTSIDVSGTGNYVLSGAELNRISYYLTGALTGDRNIIVPTAVQQYWITNNTTGAHTLTVKTAAGTGIVVDQGTAAILQCDGTNVTIAQSTGTAFPITVGEGGTGATTAAGARSNLGATATGDAVFTAVSAAAALAAVGGASASTTITAGNGLIGGGDLSANRTIDVNTGPGIAIVSDAVTLDINGLTDTAPSALTDTVPYYNGSVAGDRKMTIAELKSYLGVPPTAFKAADTARTSTVLAADPDLVLALSPGTYRFKAYLPTVVSSTAGSFSVALSFSGTQTAFWQAVTYQAAAQSDVFTSGAAPATVNCTSISTSPAVNLLEGTITVTVAGNLSITWCSTNAAVTVTLKAGATFECLKCG